MQFTFKQVQRFRQLWGHLHRAATAYSQGSINHETLKSHFSSVQRELRGVCMKCATNFETRELPILLQASPSEIETAVIDLRTKIAKENGRGDNAEALHRTKLRNRNDLDVAVANWIKRGTS
jgi:hypothetical protein